ncbi:hypothetical protein KXQ82_05005 [Mucilaginibacter sp. HMF5004]|uniref:hypothetical protein n=1 Tax=Mucilaginibacter rivuli TaxID=2857527 RepID=UPI001C5EB07B|nr:hypothetical protein [Mucilaginibacter rivuli]MBW4889059.1 hypothetical protein [Mucilaginibacter rivuli]
MKKLILLLILSCFCNKLFAQEYLHQDRRFFTTIDSRNYDIKQKSIIVSNHIKSVIEIRIQFLDKKVKDTLYKTDFNKAGYLIGYSRYYENKPYLNYVYLYNSKGYIISDTTQDRANRYYYDKFNNNVRHTFYDHSPSVVNTSFTEILNKFNTKGDIVNSKSYYTLYDYDKITPIEHVLMEDCDNIYDSKRRLIKLRSMNYTPTTTYTQKEDWNYALKGDTLIGHHKSYIDISKMKGTEITDEDVFYDRWGNRVKKFFKEPKGEMGMEKLTFNHLGQLIEIILESHYTGKLRIETTKYVYDDVGKVTDSLFYRDGELFSRSIYYYEKY